MPLVRKARKPKQPNPAKEIRDASALVDSHEDKFTRAFTGILRSLLTPDALKALSRAAGKYKDPDKILSAVPFFDPGDPKTYSTWENFARRTEQTYTQVINDTIRDESKKRGWKLRTMKAEGDIPEPKMPVRPTADEFVRVRALTRVVDMSNKERARIKAILRRGLKAGAHPTTMIDEIADTVGLTEFQAERLGRKVAQARAQGMGARAVRELRQREAASV